ncbi:iron chelate uptake ABC transporter family permease subunit [Phytoactinopolyspora sp. XMNu-373]|uniref:Iron chelate uptake ABC transporter family permease subunit n=1 Tax=Phytoactinopolyspora mesophila TaxID=2650750 RepID=A0A7K3M3S9_9ACTN|nr:iron ABC transporter permease [Phytoactinopolyspora mesophila]NDL57098.1 iron chelate uptake ABC transporter family permease subunit [Phytoactinopolyspora mesophila]
MPGAGRPAAGTTDGQRLVGPRQVVVFGCLAAGCVGAFLATLAWGSVSIPLGEVVGILSGQDAGRDTWTSIVMDLRLPRAITAVLAGAAMALAGLAMQTLFRNALAEPYVLGVTAGASVGVGLVLLPQGATAGLSATLLAAVAPLQGLGVVGAAAAGAFSVLLVMSAIAARVQNTVIVLVAGMMFGAFLTAITNVLVYFARPEAVVAFTAWQFGSFQGVRTAQLPILGGLVVLGVLILVVSTKQLNASLLGERYAQSMGMSVRRFRLTAMASTALLAGAVTAYAGPIAFLGIAAPHLARGLFGTTDHRLLIPGSALVGAVIALIAGIFAQLPGTDTVLPLNAALALIGAPVVLRVLLRINRNGGGFSV